MVSGNFLVGQSLSIAGFDQYVKIPLAERGYTVSDYVTVEEDNHGKVLAAISGEGNLEQVLHEIMGVGGEQLFEAQRRGDQGLTAYQYQLGDMRHSISSDNESPLVPRGHFSTLGSYSHNETASALFPALAQRYLLEDAKSKADEFEDTLQALGKKFSA
ncbi:MAG: hypothetical protein WCV90_01030 [Candidatus Woesearchaeota archaeon]|jgi:hypothetical protein